ncbi:MAG: hypothetical protein GY832_24455 [Chloroflexi bacterium]|nr:hypothetical protein [Chloroflexota bacterium]
MVIDGLWMVILVPAPSLATTETEERSLGSPRFLPVQNLVMNLGPQIATRIGLTRPSPLPRRLPLFCPGGALACFPWAGGGGVRGGELALSVTTSGEVIAAAGWALLW